MLCTAAGCADWTASLEDAGGAVHSQRTRHADTEGGRSGKVKQGQALAIVLVAGVDGHCSLPVCVLEAAKAVGIGITVASGRAEWWLPKGKVELSY